jgi:hypothetical protein
VPDLPGENVAVMLNARVEMKADTLRSLVRRVLDETVQRCGGSYTESEVAYFHPSYPHPSHRIG